MIETFSLMIPSSQYLSHGKVTFLRKYMFNLKRIEISIQ